MPSGSLSRSRTSASVAGTGAGGFASAAGGSAGGLASDGVTGLSIGCPPRPAGMPTPRASAIRRKASCSVPESRSDGTARGVAEPGRRTTFDGDAGLCAAGRETTSALARFGGSGVGAAGRPSSTILRAALSSSSSLEHRGGAPRRRSVRRRRAAPPPARPSGGRRGRSIPVRGIRRSDCHASGSGGGKGDAEPLGRALNRPGDGDPAPAARVRRAPARRAPPDRRRGSPRPRAMSGRRGRHWPRRPSRRARARQR